MEGSLYCSKVSGHNGVEESTAQRDKAGGRDAVMTDETRLFDSKS
jgi:hypothetical protein